MIDVYALGRYYDSNFLGAILEVRLDEIHC
mgnify:CR=1 FL=1